MAKGSRVIRASWRQGIVSGVGILGAIGLASASLQARTFHIDYSLKPEPADLLAFDLSILSAESKADLKPKQAAGGKALGYLSIVEAKPGTPAATAAEKAGVPTMGENTDWGSVLLDVTDPRWEKVVLEELAPALVEKGFDGFFIDTADSVALLGADRCPARLRVQAGGRIAYQQAGRRSSRTRKSS